MEEKIYLEKVEYFKNEFKNIMKDQDNFKQSKALKLLDDIEKFENENGKISEMENIGELDISWLK